MRLRARIHLGLKTRL